MCFMAPITTLVFFDRSQDLAMSVLVRRVHVVFLTAGSKGGGKRVVRHVKPSRCGEASRKPPALTQVRTQPIGALAQGSYPLSYPSAPTTTPCSEIILAHVNFLECSSFLCLDCTWVFHTPNVKLWKLSFSNTDQYFFKIWLQFLLLNSNVIIDYNLIEFPWNFSRWIPWNFWSSLFHLIPILMDRFGN